MLEQLKKTEFWFDILVLSCLWLLVAFLPQSLLQYQEVSLIDILKIVALISTLEVIGFFAHHLLGDRAGILIQGLLGGFVSSTMTFVRFTQNTHESSFHPRTVSRALLLATVGMLVECIFIVFTIVPNYAATLSKPFFVQMLTLLFIVAIMSFGKNKISKTTNDKIVLDEPIIWKKVGSFALFILGLIYFMRILATTLSLPYTWTALVMSLFEAHGVLTAALTELRNQDLSHMMEIALIILLGNVLSKAFFLFKGKNKAIRFPVLASLLGSLILAWGSTFI